MDIKYSTSPDNPTPLWISSHSPPNFSLSIRRGEHLIPDWNDSSSRQFCLYDNAKLEMVYWIVSCCCCCVVVDFTFTDEFARFLAFAFAFQEVDGAVFYNAVKAQMFGQQFQLLIRKTFSQKFANFFNFAAEVLPFQTNYWTISILHGTYLNIKFTRFMSS